MTEPELRFVTCASTGGLHRMAYWQWGGDDRRKPVVVCVHGLTRNGRDFDTLGAHLASRYRIVCPDVAGRGRSDRLPDPRLYTPLQYVADCVTLIARLDEERIAWLGTSMGGLMGMALASMPGNAIRTLILNDVGPVVDPKGLARIADYVGADPRFPSFEAAEQALRMLMLDFGPHTDAQFRLLSQHFLVRIGDEWGFAYDPAIAVPFRETKEVPEMWPYYERIACPTLVIRGEQSDILPLEVAESMAARGPKARVISFAGVGHAPTLIADDQIAAVATFLDRNADAFAPRALGTG
ncbi:MAG: alpha/beta hydrolase [Burkholderiaceae bacterium]|nr:alpha/beta hydrolase [Burkholderiaceae bacterium]